MALTRPRAAQIYDIDYKQATRVVTVSNITLAGGAPSQVDGVNLSLKDRVLVTGQSTGSQNGIYYVTTLGTGSNGTWTRSLDTDATGELLSGTIVMVTEGVIYADTQWKLTTNDPITIGVTALTFVQNYLANVIQAGNSNVTVLTNANILLSSAGTANVVDVFGTGIKITGTESVTGNVTVGNLLTAGQISSTGNITTDGYVLGNVFYANGITASKIYSGTSEVNVTSSGGNVNVTVGGTSNVVVFSTAGEYVTGLVSVSGNVTGGNLLTAGLVSATGNALAGNLLTAGQISATGNITTAGYFLGNVACASGIYASRIFNGTTEANIGTANGNVNVSVGGTSNVWVAATTGIYVTGLQSVTGNVTGGNILTAGLISSTGNATAGNVSTAGQVTVTGNITGGNVLTAGLVSATGNATAGNLLTAGQVTATGNITGGNIITAGLISATGVIYSGNIYTSGGLSLTGNTITSSGATLTIDPNGSGAVDGNVVIAGNLSVQGNVTYIDSNVITTNEKSITLANNVSTGSLADGAGIDVGNTTIAYWRFNNATTSWQSNIGITPAANATLNLGGTSNYWATVYATGATITGNVTGGNVLTSGLMSSTGNVTAGNVLTSGLISATGNISGSYLFGNASQITGVKTFNQIFVTGATTVNASTLTSNVTLAAGNNISLTSDGNTITIGYTSATGSTSIFATGGDMGLIANPVTSSEDLGDVITVANISYDLGGLFSTTTTNQLDVTGFSGNVNAANVNLTGNIFVAGNIYQGSNTGSNNQTYATLIQVITYGLAF